MAAGAALYQIMSDLVFRTTSIDRTCSKPWSKPRATHGLSRVALEDPVPARSPIAGS